MKRFTLLLLALLAITAKADNYLDFLYRWMPVADSIDHPRSFWQENVDLALRARDEMPWGKTVPEREFRHFVLPVRVNNEDLDSARRVIYRELAPRVRHLSMKEAALEVNHWLHEKANYRPSDGRTSSPLATIRTTWGRCGEESTLGVAAMRAVGIPARQVYTPRWAHTDDNHAWVEVWVDGRWHFLGACEPEPILDLAWFNAPAARGMLMATNVFGHYDGPEQQLYRDSCYTRINVTDNYASVRKASVRVLDDNGVPLANIPVSFRLYNYAELYPLFSTTTDADGRASLICGRGDLTAWASDGNRYGVVKLPADVDSDVALRLSGVDSLDLELTPPTPSVSLPVPTEQQAAENARRFALEDSIRGARMSTFCPDGILAKAYGNHKVIGDFLASAADSADAMTFLATLTDKDLRDVAAEVLFDAYTYRLAHGQPWISPRISNELLTPFCQYFDANVPNELKNKFLANPALIYPWVEQNITLCDQLNPNHYCISPAGVWRSRMADSHSRDIFFVALCRWLGVDAAIDAVTGNLQCRYLSGNESNELLAEKAVVSLCYTGDIPADPAYYTHFTLSKLSEGLPQLLNYDDITPLSSLTPLSIDPGEYILTTGRRMADGSVAARLSRFTAVAGDTVAIPLVIPQSQGKVSVIGAFNADPLLSVTGRGFFVLGIIAPGHEPSTHLLNELTENKQAIEKWGKKIVLLFTSVEEMNRFERSKYPNLPENVVFGVDKDSVYFNQLAGEFRYDVNKASMPALIVGDTFNRVVFSSHGYNVGLGQTLVNLLPQLPE